MQWEVQPLRVVWRGCRERSWWAQPRLAMGRRGKGSWDPTGEISMAQEGFRLKTRVCKQRSEDVLGLTHET